MCYHNTLTGLLGKLALLWCTAAFVGCATEPSSVHEQDYDRVDAGQALVDRFNIEKRRCRARGGRMVLIMEAGGKIDRRTMELAYCETGQGVFF